MPWHLKAGGVGARVGRGVGASVGRGVGLACFEYDDVKNFLFENLIVDKVGNKLVFLHRCFQARLVRPRPNVAATTIISLFVLL